MPYKNTVFSGFPASRLTEPQMQKIFADPKLREIFGSKYTASSLYNDVREPFNVNPNGKSAMYIDGGLFENGI